MLDQGRGGEVARAQVAECAHFFAQLQETLLRADGAGAPFLFAELVVGGGGENGGGGMYRSTDGTEENGIGVLGRGQGLVGQRVAGGVNRGLYSCSVSVLWSVMHGILDGTYTAQQVVLEVEGDVIAALLDDAENLW